MDKEKISASNRGITDHLIAMYVEQEKVTNMCTAPKKVTCTVGTFLNNNVGFYVITAKTQPQKVTCTVGTFLNSDAGFYARTTKTRPKGYLYGGNLFERQRGFSCNNH